MSDAWRSTSPVTRRDRQLARPRRGRPRAHARPSAPDPSRAHRRLSRRALRASHGRALLRLASDRAAVRRGGGDGHRDRAVQTSPSAGVRDRRRDRAVAGRQCRGLSARSRHPVRRAADARRSRLRLEPGVPGARRCGRRRHRCPAHHRRWRVHRQPRGAFRPGHPRRAARPPGGCRLDRVCARQVVDRLPWRGRRRPAHRNAQPPGARLAGRRGRPAGRLFGEPVALLVGDIDHFKQINDRAGHRAGDAVLREIAYRMRKNLRVFEAAYRVGGEEFVVLLTGLRAQEPAEIAERLRGRSGESRSRAFASRCPSASRTSDEDEPFDYSRLFERADASLYEAKRAGRDRVRLAGELAEGQRRGCGLEPVPGRHREIRGRGLLLRASPTSGAIVARSERGGPPPGRPRWNATSSRSHQTIDSTDDRRPGPSSPTTTVVGSADRSTAPRRSLCWQMPAHDAFAGRALARGTTSSVVAVGRRDDRLRRGEALRGRSVQRARRNRRPGTVA